MSIRRTSRAAVSTSGETPQAPTSGETPQAPTRVTPDYPGLPRRVPAILYIADAGDAGLWHYVTPQIEEILGFSPAEWCDDPQLWIEQLHPEDRERVLGHERRHCDGAGEPGAVEYRMRDRGGRVLWLRDDAVLVRDRGGQLRWHGVLSDITERKHAEAELEQRAAQQAAVARLGERALEGASTTQLMQDAVTCAAEILGVEIAAVAELLPDGELLVLRAGYGWPDSAGGQTRSPAGADS